MHLLMPVLIMDLTMEQNPYRYEIRGYVPKQTVVPYWKGEGPSEDNLVLSAELIM